MSDENRGVVGRSLSRIWRGVTLVRVSLSNLIFLLLLGLLFVTISRNAPEPVAENTALVLNPTGSVVEQLSYREPLDLMLGGQAADEQEVLLTDILEAIDRSRDDPAITALVMDLDGLAYVGISKTLEIGLALERFKTSGKTIIAVADYYSQDQYLLASYADEIHLNQLGAVFIEGYASYRNYFKAALDKLKVEMHVFVAGANKSAMEPFMSNQMSASNREINLEWLNGIWSHYTALVESNRGLDEGAINAMLAKYDELHATAGGNFAELAKQSGLVDSLSSHSEINDRLVELAGAADEDGGAQSIDFQSYLWRSGLDPNDGFEGKQVGVIVAKGIILDGGQPAGRIGGDSLASLIREARQDDGIAALVLRIDSGGGSTFASEVIRQEILNAQADGIPVIASMGAVAASGGYWISMDADQIWAMPTTLTGSIGVFSSIPTFDRSLAELGVFTDGVGTSPLAGSFRVDRPLNPTLSAVFQRSVDHTYENFIRYVAAGRDLPLEDVRVAAEGRVWTGEKALELGLVDHLGGLEDAIAAAAAMVGLAATDFRVIEKPLSPQEQFLQQLSRQMSLWGLTGSGPAAWVAPLDGLLAPLKSAAQFMASLNDPTRLYVRCLVCAAP